MENIQHGVGGILTATSVPAVRRFEEPSGVYKKARSVSVTNKGPSAVLLLANAAIETEPLANQFDNLSPIYLGAGDSYHFLPTDAATGAWYSNVAYAALSGTSSLLVNAY